MTSLFVPNDVNRNDSIPFLMNIHQPCIMLETALKAKTKFGFAFEARMVVADTFQFMDIGPSACL